VRSEGDLVLGGLPGSATGVVGGEGQVSSTQQLARQCDAVVDVVEQVQAFHRERRGALGAAPPQGASDDGVVVVDDEPGPGPEHPTCGQFLPQPVRGDASEVGIEGEGGEGVEVAGGGGA
jgi:hypothetical protein